MFPSSLASRSLRDEDLVTARAGFRAADVDALAERPFSIGTSSAREVLQVDRWLIECRAMLEGQLSMRWGVGQLADRLTVNQEVGGSSPSAPVKARMR